jgi:hypothetical protein
MKEKKREKEWRNMKSEIKLKIKQKLGRTNKNNSREKAIQRLEIKESHRTRKGKSNTKTRNQRIT